MYVIDDAISSTYIFMSLLALAAGFSIRGLTQREILPITVSQELKGLAILTIVFGHVGFFLVSDYHFLYPFSMAFGRSVDVFLFLSGYGLTVGMTKRKLPALAFYQRRVVRVFIPFWLVLITLFVMDALVLQRFYEPMYMLRSLLGFFPRADLWLDVNSVFWFIGWILLAYLLFPLLFNEKKPWFSALCLFAITSLLVWWSPQPIEKVAPFYRLHTAALPLGMIAAWLLQSQNVTAQKIQSSLSYIKHDLAAVPHYALLSVLLAIGVLSLLLETKTPVQEQAGNMITMLAFISVFALKRFEIRLLYWLGFYSFEIYMLHWPLLARYDVFFKYLPASWLAMLAHFVLYIGLGILVQKAAAWVEKKLPI